MLAARDDEDLQRAPHPVGLESLAGRALEPPKVADRDDSIGIAVDEQHRAAERRDRPCRRDGADGVAAWLEEDVRGQPGERVGEETRNRQAREAERLPRQPVRVRGRRRGDNGRDARLCGRGQECPDPAHRVAQDPDRRHVGTREQRVHAGQRVGPELARRERQLLGRVGAVPADVEREHVEARRVQHERVRKRSVARGLPAVDEQDRGPGGAVAGRDPPGRQPDPRGRHIHVLEGEPEEARVMLGRMAVRVARAGAVRLRESPGGDRRDGEGRGQAEPAAGHRRVVIVARW